MGQAIEKSAAETLSADAYTTTRRLRGASVLLLLSVVCLSLIAPRAYVAAGDGRRANGPAEKPQAGWLYVLDSNNGRKTAQILVVNPADGSVVRTYPTGMMPDFALSPDGTRLYVASTRVKGESTHEQPDELATIDTATGKVLRVVANPDRILYIVTPPSSGMALAPNGRWLYVMKYETITPDNVLYWVETYDTRAGKFLPEKAEVPLCGWGRLIASDKERQVQVVCTDTKDVRLLKITPRGSAVGAKARLTRKDVTAAELAALQPAAAGLVNDAASMLARERAKKLIDESASHEVTAGLSVAPSESLVLMKNGQLFKVNESNAAFTNTAVSLPEGKLIHSAAAPSPGRLLLGLSVPFYKGPWLATEIVAVNPNGSAERSAQTSRGFHYLSVSRDGQTLYAVNSTSSELMLIDAATLSETRVLGGLGVTPSLIIEAP